MLTAEAIAHTHNLRRSGHRYVGPCPKCGGSAKSDKFQIRDDMGFKCYGCGFKGDLITWLREMNGLSCPEAFEAAGQNCDRHDCGVWTTCRMGDGSGRQQRKASSASVPTVRNDQPRTTTQKSPQQQWAEYATNLVNRAQADLQQQPDAIRYLKQRGINKSSGPSYQLGWLDHMRRPLRTALGLPPEREGKTKLWIPEGLVIATRGESGAVNHIRIRRTDEARAKFAPDRKYQAIEGGDFAPHLIQRPNARGTVVVEAHLDGIAIAQALPDVNVLILITVDMPPTDHQHQLLQQTPVILIALDAGDDSKAGQTAAKKWQENYRHARYWPVPQGKDPGEYIEQGGDLAVWIYAGLPAAVKSSPAPKKQDQRQSPLVENRRGGGAAEINLVLPEHAKGKTTGGHDYVVAYNADHVGQLQRHYPQHVVFSPAEIAALKGMDKQDAELMLLTKKEFGGVIEGTGEITPGYPMPPEEVPVVREQVQESLGY